MKIHEQITSETWWGSTPARHNAQKCLVQWIGHNYLVGAPLANNWDSVDPSTAEVIERVAKSIIASFPERVTNPNAEKYDLLNLIIDFNDSARTKYEDVVVVLKKADA